MYVQSELQNARAEKAVESHSTCKHILYRKLGRNAYFYHFVDINIVDHYHWINRNAKE